MKKTTDLYLNTTYGRTLRDTYISLDTANKVVPAKITVTNSKQLNDRIQALMFKVRVLTPTVNFGEVKPLPFPYTVTDGGEFGVLLLDLRTHLKSTSKLSEENQIWEIKSSSFDFVEGMLTLCEFLTLGGSKSSSDVLDNVLMGDTCKAYVNWMSNSISRSIGITNDFAVVQRVRLSCALYFIAKVNDQEVINEDFLSYAKIQMMRKLGFNSDALELVTVESISKRYSGKLGIADLLIAITDDPRFAKLTDLTVLQVISSHLYLGSTNALVMLAVDNPYAFLTCIRFSFTRDFRSRSNFKTMLEQAGLENSLKAVAVTVERIIDTSLR